MADAPSSESPIFEPRPVAAPIPARAALAWMVRSSRAVHPERTLTGLSQAAILFCHLLARRRAMRDWHAAGKSPLAAKLASHPALVSVVRRPYISTGWDASRRLGAVAEHYCHPSGLAGLLRPGPESWTCLASLASRAGTVDIVLDSPAWFVHEGELCLNLFHEGRRIYTLAFSLGFDGGEAVAYVGALQGLGSADALRVYRTLTLAMHGLRPRDLLIQAFRIVCRESGLARWLAVGDERRVGGSSYFGASMPVRSRYDAAWAEHGGCPRTDGFHAMPIELARRTHAAIPTRKRSSYRQRYEMLDRLDADLRRALGPRAEPNPSRPRPSASRLAPGERTTCP